jgi:hypothetical protein
MICYDCSCGLYHLDLRPTTYHLQPTVLPYLPCPTSLRAVPIDALFDDESGGKKSNYKIRRLSCYLEPADTGWTSAFQVNLVFRLPDGCCDNCIMTEMLSTAGTIRCRRSDFDNANDTTGAGQETDQNNCH